MYILTLKNEILLQNYSKNYRDMSFAHFLLLPLELRDAIISNFDEKCAFALTQVSKYFSENVLRLCLKNVSHKKSIKIDDKKLKKLTFINRLMLTRNSNITDESVKELSCLRKLFILNCGAQITDKSISKLTQLDDLLLDGDDIPLITDNSLSLLTNLRCLTLSGDNIGVTNKSVCMLTQLNYLNLSFSNNITDSAILFLTSLSGLNLYGNKNITDLGLSALTNLTYVNLCYCSDKITDSSVQKLTNLRSIKLARNYGKITYSSISLLTNLTDLKIF